MAKKAERKPASKPVKRQVKALPAPGNQLVMPAETAIVQKSQTDMLIQLAADKDFPVEKLEKLIDLKNREEERVAKKEFDLHFAEMQGEFPILPRSKKSRHHKYCPLETMIQLCRPIISKHGFSYSFDATPAVDGKKIETIVINGYGSERKHSMDIYVEDPLKSNEGKQVTTRNQELGSADTYAHRYLFKSAFGFAEEDEDDDGNGGSDNRDDDKKVSNNPACPSCDSNAKVIISKFQKNGKYYCMGCQKGFNAETQKTSPEPDQDAPMTKEEREMIFTVLSKEEQVAFKDEILAASKIGAEAVRDTRKKYRELYKTRIVNQAKPSSNLNDVSY